MAKRTKQGIPEYIRFRNAEMAVTECFLAIDEIDSKPNKLDMSEYRAAKNMFSKICEFLVKHDVIEDYDEVALESLLTKTDPYSEFDG